jgi:hypothetical protein
MWIEINFNVISWGRHISIYFVLLSFLTTRYCKTFWTFPSSLGLTPSTWDHHSTKFEPLRAALPSNMAIILLNFLWDLASTKNKIIIVCIKVHFIQWEVADPQCGPSLWCSHLSTGCLVGQFHFHNNRYVPQNYCMMQGMSIFLDILINNCTTNIFLSRRRKRRTRDVRIREIGST